MKKANLGYFSQFFRKVLKADFSLQKAYILNLPNSRANGLVKIGCFAVYDPINGIAHILHDTYILEPEQSLMRSDNTKEFNDFLAFLNIQHKSLLTLNAACV